MIYQLELAPQSGCQLITGRLETSFYWIKEKGYTLSVEKPDECDQNSLLITLCGPDRTGVFNNEDIIYIFKHQMAEIISEIIMGYWEKRIIQNKVERQYRRIPIDEQARIIEKASDFLSRCNENESLNLLLKFGRKNKIAHRVLDHLHNSNALNIEGLIHFRLQEYLREVNFAIDLAYEDLRNEKQYNEFVKLLKYFVETQPPKVQEVNIFIEESGLFRLWDEAGNAIEQDFVELYLEEIINNEANLDDLLISILMTISPRRIVFHSTGGLPEGEPTRIISQVFKERIVLCKGCDKCLFIH